MALDASKQITVLLDTTGNKVVLNGDLVITDDKVTFNEHVGDSVKHLTAEDREILLRTKHFKGVFVDDVALTTAYPTAIVGDNAIIASSDTLWVWDGEKQGGAGWVDTGSKGSVVSVNGQTGEVVITLATLGLTTDAAGIEMAISKAHAHANSDVLGKLSDDSGELAYNGAGIGGIAFVNDISDTPVFGGKLTIVVGDIV